MKKLLCSLGLGGLLLGGLTTFTQLVQNKKLVLVQPGKVAEATSISKIPLFNNTKVTQLAKLRNNTHNNLFVGTTKGLFWSINNGLDFKLVPLGQNTQTTWVVVQILTYEKSGTTPELFVIATSTTGFSHTHSQELFQIKFSTGNVETVNKIVIPDPSSNYVTQVYITTANHLFVGTNNGLFESESTGKITFTKINTLTGHINSFHQDKDNFLFVTSLKSVYMSVDENPGSSQSYRTPFTLESTASSLDKIAFVTQNQNTSYYWMGVIRTDVKGILYGSQNGQSFSPLISPQIPSFKTHTFGFTKGIYLNNAVWFSTLNYGVEVVQDSRPPYTKNVNGVSNDFSVTSLVEITVQSSWKNSTTSLWAGNANEDLYQSTNLFLQVQTSNL